MFQDVVGSNPSSRCLWTFLTLIFCKNFIVYLKINEKEAGDGPFKNNDRDVNK